MLACDGSVTTAWACANVNRMPRAASASMVGVRAGPPAAPIASARNVSIVIMRTFRSADRRKSCVDPPPPHAIINPIARADRRRTSKRLEITRLTGELCPKTLDQLSGPYYSLRTRTSAIVTNGVRICTQGRRLRPPGGCMSGALRRASLLVCLAFLVGSSPAFAQVSTGEIFGKVTDTTGAVLPGVTVTISSPALIQPQTNVSTETGAYRFARIPIGTYTVSFDLTGLKKMVRAGGIISAGFNAQINAKLELSTVQETVTVSGESPVVDTKSATGSASFSKEALEKIPSARDPWVILEQTPGVMMSGSNVGGNLSGQQTSFSAMGSSSNQQWNIDGAVVSDIASGNSSPTYYDFDSFEEIQITTAGADASQQGAGVQVNFITKSGSNNLTGYGRFYDTNDKCFGEFGHCQAI